jgi:hypothetical protein
VLLRTASASAAIVLTLAVSACGSGGAGDDDAVRFTSKDVRSHFKEKTGIRLAVLATDSPAVDILGPPNQAAIERYGSFTVNVAKSKGAIKALQSSHIGTQKRFDNVVVDWISTKGEDRAPYERSLAVFESLGD